jgi:hypothetical protein
MIEENEMKLQRELASALRDATRVLEHLCDDLRLDDGGWNCPAEFLCGDPNCDECGCLVLHRNAARQALSNVARE